MCEHNLVIGKTYVLVNGNGTCSSCKGHYNPPARDAKYIGDSAPNIHRFVPEQKCYCPLCGATLQLIDSKCEDEGPIDVTQEFLSLPVRSIG